MDNSTTGDGEKPYDVILRKRREKWVKLFAKFENADGNDVEIPITDLPVQSKPTKKMANMYRRATANATVGTNDRRSPNDLRSILNPNEVISEADVQNANVLVDGDSDHSTVTDSDNSAELTDSDDENKAYASQKKGRRRRRGRRSASANGDGCYHCLHITNATGDSGDEFLDDLEDIIISNENVDDISFSDYEDTDTVSEYSAEFSDPEEDNHETENVPPAEKKRKLSDSETGTEESNVKRRDTSMYKEVNLYINAIKADFEIDSD